MNLELLKEPLSSAVVKTRDQNGFKLSYVEGHYAIRKANEIFGFDGWTRRTLEVCEVQSEQVDNKWRVSYTCRSEVTVGDVVRHGLGFGQGIDRDKGRAHESAIKEAETDAMKRALMTFGDPFGLALYDKDQTHVAKETTAPAKDNSKKLTAEEVREASAARYLKETIGLSPDECRQYVKDCKDKGISWADVCLEASGSKITTFDGLIDRTFGIPQGV